MNQKPETKKFHIKSKSVPKCCYCGTSPATTKDHIPPKAIFTRPRPNDLITVPACARCNNSASKLDERFMVYLGMHVARQRGEAERLFKETVLATIRHNGTLRRQILSKTKSVHLATKSGIITGKGYAVTWDSDAHDSVIERMVKGLFFHHYQKTITKQVRIVTYWFNKLPNIDFDLLNVIKVANGAFTYAYNKADDREFDSIWIFQFYGGHWAGGIILDDRT